MRTELRVDSRAFNQPVGRRTLIATALGAGASLVASGPRTASAANASPNRSVTATELGVAHSTGVDQTAVLQKALDEAAARGLVLRLPPGAYRVAGGLKLKPGQKIAGTSGSSRLIFTGQGTFLSADNAHNIHIEGVVFDGGLRPLDAFRGADALLTFVRCQGLRLRDVTIVNSGLNGLSLRECSGAITDTTISGATNAGLFSIDAKGLELAHNHVTDCGNNGILVWTTRPGEDATQITNNRIERIAALGGGSGQNGNGINIYRAGHVLVTGNRIADCAFSAIRANAASNIQMIANSCARLGEVALYAEFAFEGAVIASNLVDGAADGIAVTNFNEGGRLAVIQGNLVRNLFRRETSQDKRGIGIGVEADAAVSGNVIENAPTAGIFIGWSQWQRGVAATGNVIRNARIGIAFQAVAKAGPVLIANNLITDAPGGAIRAMDHFTPLGTDLARAGADVSRYTNLAIAGNMAA